ncbi:MAG TPA: hypothetical protein VIJ22_04960 [Polyangiaceae bacterium]
MIATFYACSSTSASPSTSMDGGAEAASTGTVVAQLPSPDHIVTDGLNLYVTAWPLDGGDGEVVRIPTDGGGSTVIATTGGPGLAIDDEWVYLANDTSDDTGHVTNGGTIDRVAKTGGVVQTVASSPEPGEIAVDDTNVYWTDLYQDNCTIWVAPKAGSVSPTLLVTTGAELIGGITLDATHVYWIEVDALPSGSLRRISKSGGPTETVANGFFAYQYAAQDDGGIYAGLNEGLDGSPAGILRYDTAAGSTRLLGPRRSSPVGIAVDSAHVYWTDDVDGVLVAPVDGGAAVQLASNVVNSFPVGIAVANGVAYWAAPMVGAEGERVEGAVRSIAIPADP